MGRRFNAGSTSILPRILIATLSVVGVLTLAACNSSSSSSTTSYVTGVVANGAPLAGASLILTDANGATRTTTTDSNGTYTIEATGLVAPFVIRASGVSGDAWVEMTSMLGTGPVAGQILQMDITPLTNAIAALVSHNGDPTALSTADVNSANLSGRLTYVRNYIANSLSGNTLGYAGDPISTQFSTNGYGYDGVLDNLAVVNNPGGNNSAGFGASVAIYDKYTWPSTNVTNASASPPTTAVDDTGEMTSVSTPVAVVTAPLSMTQNTDFTTTLVPLTKLDVTAIALPGNSLNSGWLASLQTAINQCYATTSPGSGNSACSSYVNLASSGYLNDGQGLFPTSLSAGGYTFDPPAVVRYVTPTEAVVHLSWMDSSGIHGGYDTEVSCDKGNTASCTTAWQLVGNQHQFAASINSVAEMRQDLGTATTAAQTFNAYTVGLRIRVANASNIMWAQVSGMGLGSSNIGALLMPQANCSYLTFVSNSAGGYSGQAAHASGGNCDDYYRLTGTGLSGNSITWPSSSNYAPANDPVSTSLFEPYTFDIHYCSGGTVSFGGSGQPVCNGGTEKDVYYVRRLSSPVPSIDQAARMAYPTPVTTTGAALSATSEFANVTWGYGPSNGYALPVDGLNVQIADGSSCAVSTTTTSMPFSASMNTSTGSRYATATTPVSNSTTAFNAIASCSQKLINQVTYRTHRRDGLLIQSVIEYANY